MKLFPEELHTLAELLEEWYAGIREFTEKCNGIFSERAKQYDKASPSWHRHPWPDGYVSELRKKVDRVDQMLTGYDPKDPTGSVKWSKVQGELADLLNYSRMFASITEMWIRRSAK